MVLNHANAELYYAGLSTPLWQAANAALTSVRMPMFFLLSGLFAARSLTSSWTSFRRDKLARFGWLYLVWVVLFAAPVAARALLAGRDAGADVAGWFTAAATADEALWYLLALPAYFLVARCTRRVPVAGQLAVAAVPFVLIATGAISTGSWGVDHIAAYVIFFLAGCHGSRRIRAGVDLAPWWALPALAGGWLAFGAAVLAVPTSEPVMTVLMPVAAVAAALLLARLAARSAGCARALGWLGRNTLPIYVLHMAPLLLIAPLVVGAATASVWWPPLLAAVALAVSLAVWRLTWRIPGLYRLPVTERASSISS